MDDNDNSLNTFRLMDVTVHHITRWDSGPDGETPDRQRRPNAHAKQRSVHTRYKKHRGLIMLTIRFSNGMSTMIGIVNARK